MTDWQTYFSREKSGIARSTTVDLELSKSAPQSERAWLLWVWMGMKNPNPHGLSSAEESPALHQIQKTVEQMLANEANAIHFARVYRERRCELWFYAVRNEQFEQAIASAMTDFADYQFITGSRSDPKWSAYLEEYYPTDPKHWHQVVNQKLIRTLKTRNETLEVPHRVDHTLFFKSRENRAKFVAAAQQQGFALAGEFDARENRDHPHGVVVHERAPQINLARMNQSVFTLIDLAQPLGGSYDGWGTKQARRVS
jgi:hypothetical protein